MKICGQNAGLGSGQSSRTRPQKQADDQGAEAYRQAGREQLPGVPCGDGHAREA